ncbi:response regulator [Flavobacteriaceae bacterium TP-CH-4]|uniref:histidine kinase n=1 Tax=Pelagihabitans pacificus TaxID=2696054 RepID=A0A967AVI9_9FLAO|nr:ATP-binding protein [Pelagihabitans pacificus]NHF59848.1 response regulator [Pelagihabitans pacificus]
MKPKDLLAQITHVESLLNEFSFDELSSDEAGQLKKSFESFKHHLQEKVLTQNGITSESLNNSSSPTGKRSHDKLQRDNQSEASLLVAHVSHEIRTPLNGIIGFTDLLKEDSLSTTQLELVNAIQSASYSLMEIINELLEYSKLSAGLETFESVHFNFYALTRDILYLCKTLIVEEKMNLEADIDTSIPEVLVGDPAKLSQVLLNLLGNAIKFAQKGEIRLRIVLKKQKDGQLLLEFLVSDQGIGIGEEELPYIFDSYRQVGENTSTKYGGTGLGLSIVKEIIVNQGGHITVASNLGEGTTFRFVLPYLVGDKSKLPQKALKKEYLTEGAKLLKGTGILVFEDNLLNQRLIEQRLKKWGCNIWITDNCQYGLHILEKQRIDLVLMDLRMPGMSGFDVTQRIRENENERLRQVPIVALTADFTIQDKEQSELHGINDYILKPYSPDELLLKLIKNKRNMEHIDNIEEMTLTTVPSQDKERESFDLEPILGDCMGDLSLLEELIRLYKQNAIEFIGAAKIHLEQRNFEELEFVLHKIKSGLAMMRTESLHTIVSEMHTSSKEDKDTKHMEFLYGCFLEEYPIVEKKIDDAFEKLKNNSR